MREVARCILDETPAQIEQLKALVASGDTENAGKEAHKIKGAVRNAGGKAIGVLAFTLEQAAKAGDVETLARHLPELEPRFAEFKAAIEKALSER